MKGNGVCNTGVHCEQLEFDNEETRLRDEIANNGMAGRFEGVVAESVVKPALIT